MEEFHFVGLDDVLYFFDEEMKYSGTIARVRDQFELDACIESPKHTFDGEYLEDIFGMATKYIVAFVIRHPFSDGNKRIGVLCALVFLEANGINYQENFDGELADIVFRYLRNEIEAQDIRQHFIENSNKGSIA